MHIPYFFFNLVFVEKRLIKVHSVSVCIFPSLVTFEPSGQFQVNGTKEVSAIITLLPASWKWVTVKKKPINAHFKGMW